MHMREFPHVLGERYSPCYPITYCYNSKYVTDWLRRYSGNMETKNRISPGIQAEMTWYFDLYPEYVLLFDIFLHIKYILSCPTLDITHLTQQKNCYFLYLNCLEFL